MDAVRRASLLCRSVRRSFAASEAVAKADRSPVTVADLGSQAIISLALADTFPADPLMGEEDAAPLRASSDLASVVLDRVREQGWQDLHPTDLLVALDRGDDEGGPGRRWWTLDPVDGTKGFLRDEQYAVALALVEDGEVVLGVLGCPNLPIEPDADLADPDAVRGCLFVAERGRGAWQWPLDDPDAAARRVWLPDEQGLVSASYAESVEAAHSSQDDAARIAERLGVTRPPVRLDSQAKYAVLARGQASIYLRLPHGGYVENVWDHAAGSIIVEEAGGRVSDVTGTPLDFTAGRHLARNRGVVAAAASIHADVVSAVRAVLGT